MSFIRKHLFKLSILPFLFIAGCGGESGHDTPKERTEIQKLPSQYLFVK